MFLSYGKLAFYLAKFFSQPVKSLHANDAATDVDDSINRIPAVVGITLYFENILIISFVQT